MKTSKILPVSFLALGLVGSGVMIATAQNMSPQGNGGQQQMQQQQMKQQMQREDYREGKGGREGGKYGHMDDDDDMRGNRGMHDGQGRMGGGMMGHGKMGGGKMGGGEMMRTLFAQIDADGDGSITQEEVDAFRAAKVAEADTSGDGALSIEEFDTIYREFTRSRMVDMFQDLDADGDGVISPEEADARFGDVVSRMDRDGDGALTLTDRGRRH